MTNLGESEGGEGHGVNVVRPRESWLLVVRQRPFAAPPKRVVAMRISVVIPAFNEEGSIGRLVEETFAAVPDSALGEVIAVDDGSDDRTGAEIKALLSGCPRLRYLRHEHRAGQRAALRSGVLAARYPVIATMD